MNTINTIIASWIDLYVISAYFAKMSGHLNGKVGMSLYQNLTEL